MSPAWKRLGQALLVALAFFLAGATAGFVEGAVRTSGLCPPGRSLECECAK